MAISLKTLRASFGAMLEHSSMDPTLSLARIRNALVAYERGEIRRSAVFDIFDRELGGYGIEYIPNPLGGSRSLAAYVNLGDTYITTIVYCYDRQRFLVASWGGYYESTPEYRAYDRKQWRLEHGDES